MISLTSLQPGATLTSAANPICTATATSGTWINSAVFTNTNSGVVTLTVYVVRSGDSTGTGNILIDGQTLAQQQAYVAPELQGRFLNQGDALWASASTGGVVNAIVDGFSITPTPTPSSPNAIT